MPPRKKGPSRGRGRGGQATKAPTRNTTTSSPQEARESELDPDTTPRRKSRPKMRPIPEPEPVVVGKKRMQSDEGKDSEYGEEEIDKPAGPKKVRIRIGKSTEETRPVSDEEEDELIDDTDIMQPPEPDKVEIGFAILKGGPKGVLSLPEPFDMDTTYGIFRLRVADAFGELRDTQELVWKTDRMAKSATWLALNSEKDFDGIIKQARQTLEQENASRHRVIEKNIADAKKAKGRGKSFMPKEVPVVKEYVVFLRDLSQEKRLKEKPKSVKKDKKAEKEEAMVAVKGLAERILENEEKIEAKKCGGCGKCCVIIPGIGMNPAVHKELQKADIKFWAQVAATGADEGGNPVSLEKPPRALLLQLSDRKPEQRGTKSKAQPQNNVPAPEDPPAPAPPAPAPPAPAPLPPPFPGYPHPFGHYPPPPPGYYGPYGFPGPYGYHPGQDQGFPPGGPNYHNAYAHGAPQGLGPYGFGRMGPRERDLHLAEWLPMCDRGERGRHGDNFAGLLAGFLAQRFTHLSQLRDLTVDYLITDIEFPTTPGLPGFHMARETATRLCQYVAADLSNHM